MHGGTSTGAPKGNKNALTTGAHETILADTLTEEERSLLGLIDTDLLTQIDREIRLCEIRERRMMERIARLRDGKEMVVTSIDQTEGSNKQLGKHISKTARTESRLEQIQRVEEALTRVQAQKLRLLDLRHKYDVSKVGLKVNLTASLAEVLTRAWSDGADADGD
ncbi:hypothetical protein JC200_19020 [Alicyclobacillus sp. ALC3]|nr:hypothetical protein JC200_19020 [Alicyclobacillus sp. ALC3]